MWSPQAAGVLEQVTLFQVLPLEPSFFFFFFAFFFWQWYLQTSKLEYTLFLNYLQISILFLCVFLFLRFLSFVSYCVSDDLCRQNASSLVVCVY